MVAPAESAGERHGEAEHLNGVGHHTTSAAAHGDLGRLVKCLYCAAGRIAGVEPVRVDVLHARSGHGGEDRVLGDPHSRIGVCVRAATCVGCAPS